MFNGQYSQPFFKWHVLILYCKYHAWEGPRSSQPGLNQIKKEGQDIFLALMQTFLASKTVLLGCMFWSIIMHEDHDLIGYRHFLYHCLKKMSSKNCVFIWEFIFSSCATKKKIKKSPTSSSLIIAAHTIMQPSPCCHHVWANHGPSSLIFTFHLVHKTFEKSVLIYFLALSWCFNLWLLISDCS